MKPRIIPQNWFNPLCTIFLHRLRPISTSRKDDPIHSKESTGIYFDKELHYLSGKKRVGGLGPWHSLLKYNQVKVYKTLDVLFSHGGDFSTWRISGVWGDWLFSLGQGFQYTPALWREFLVFVVTEHRPSCSVVSKGTQQIRILGTHSYPWNKQKIFSCTLSFFVC